MAGETGIYPAWAVDAAIVQLMPSFELVVNPRALGPRVGPAVQDVIKAAKAVTGHAPATRSPQQASSLKRTNLTCT
jgi:hypothetical protein